MCPGVPENPPLVLGEVLENSDPSRIRGDRAEITRFLNTAILLTNARAGPAFRPSVWQATDRWLLARSAILCRPPGEAPMRRLALLCSAILLCLATSQAQEPVMHDGQPALKFGDRYGNTSFVEGAGGAVWSLIRPARPTSR